MNLSVLESIEPASMKRLNLMVAVLLSVAVARPAAAQPYSARRTGDVVQLEDTRSRTAVSIALSVGNIAFEMKVNGANVLLVALRLRRGVQGKTRPERDSVPRAVGEPAR